MVSCRHRPRRLACAGLLVGATLLVYVAVSSRPPDVDQAKSRKDVIHLYMEKRRAVPEAMVNRDKAPQDYAQMDNATKTKSVVEKTLKSTVISKNTPPIVAIKQMSLGDKYKKILEERRKLQSTDVNVRLNLSPVSNEQLRDVEANHPLMTICEVIAEPKKMARLLNYYQLHHVMDATQTIEDCRGTCYSKETSYATLMRGICWCYNMARHSPQVDMEWCNATCQVADTGCEVSTKQHAITMKTGVRDGNTEWTVWMRFNYLNVKVRYRGCPRNTYKQTVCSPEFERKQIEESDGEMNVDSTLIGCFTGRSILSSPTAKRITVPASSQTDNHCQRICSHHLYAVLTSTSTENTRECYCTDSLGQSRPTDTCPDLGVTVYWSQNGTVIALKFEGEVQKKGKVLVLARYRSGSSMTQSFFVRNPNSFSLFEPDKLQADYANGKADRATLMTLESFYKCDTDRMNLFLHNTAFIVWGTKMIRQRGALEDNHLLDMMDCYNMKPRPDCSPYWKEACERSEFMDSKLIRVLTPSIIKEFVERNLDVHVIHLVRDPRSLLAAQRLYGSIPYPRTLCSEMLNLGMQMQQLRKQGATNVHEVFYEQLAIQPSKYGANIYQEMGMEMPAAVKRFLRRDEYQEGDIPHNASQVVVDDPVYHRYRFLEIYSLPLILDIDTQCKDVYKFWPTHYTDFWTMVKQHRAEIYRYSSSKNQKLISNGLKEMNNS